MLKTGSNFLIVLICIFLSGCGTSYYYAEFVKPSKVYVPSQIYHLGIVNRGTSATSTAAIYTNGIPYENVSGLPQIVAYKTTEDLKKQLTEIGRYSPVTITWPQDSISNKPFGQQALSPEVIDSLCAGYGLEGILSLEAVEVMINTKGTVEVGNSVDPAGMPVRVPEFNSASRVKYSVMWRFYDNLQKKVTDTYQETYELDFEKIASSLEEANRTSTDEMNLTDVANVAADDYFMRISPYWQQDYRIYYQSGSPQFYQIALELDADGDWLKAANAWKGYIDNSEDNLAYRARFNMAVASEMLGNPRDSKYWLKQAMILKNTNTAQKYFEQIEKQILIIDVVNRQLGTTTE